MRLLFAIQCHGGTGTTFYAVKLSPGLRENISMNSIPLAECPPPPVLAIVWAVGIKPGILSM